MMRMWEHQGSLWGHETLYGDTSTALDDPQLWIMHRVFFISQKLAAEGSSPDAAALLLAFFSPDGGQAAGDRAP